MAVEYTYVDGEVAAPVLTVYSISYCGYCRHAKAFLHENGFAYRYVFIDQLPPADQFELKKMLAQPEVKSTLYPVLEIADGERLYGFNPEVWASRLGVADSGVSTASN
jgi:glutaredoxin